MTKEQFDKMRETYNRISHTEAAPDIIMFTDKNKFREFAIKYYGWTNEQVDEYLGYKKPECTTENL